MIFSMTDEVFVFLYSCFSGVLMMLFYDILSVAGKQRKCSMFILNICDGMFITVACAVMFFVNWTVSNGIVRSFEFLGAILGAIFYKLTLSRPISACLEKITEQIASFFKIFFKILLTPLAITYKMINKCIMVLCGSVVHTLRKLLFRFSCKMHTSMRTARNAIKKT